MKQLKFAIILFILTVIFSNHNLYTKAYCSVDSALKDAEQNMTVEEKLNTDEKIIISDNTNSTTNNTESKDSATDETIEIMNENKPNDTERPSVVIDNNHIENSYLQKEKINTDNYLETFSFSGFSSNEISIIKNVLEIYEENKNCGLEKYEEKIDFIPTYQEYKNAISFFHIYYGIQEDIIDIVFDIHIKGNTEAYIDIYVDNMRNFDSVRQKNTTKILKIISNFYEGSEKEKVNQIAEYIANQTTYTNGNYDVEDVLFDKKGVCNAYALTMTRFCQLLNIKCDICIGYTPSGKHAWNKITYSDGSIEYYDITFYDTDNHNRKYLGMKETPFPIDTINQWYY